MSSEPINSTQNLIQVCKRYNLFNKEFDFLCDDGSENKGEVSVFLNRDDILIRRLITQIEIFYSNSMSEAANKSIKYLKLIPQKPATFHDVIRVLEKSIPEYNDSFPKHFFGLSRNDVLNGKTIDRNMFSEQIQLAKELRPVINRAQTCGIC